MTLGAHASRGETIARTILVASSLWLAVLGGGLLFFPSVCADLLSLPDGSARALPLVGGGQLGFAMMNWTGRSAVYGGIYGRPIVVGNFANAVITSSALMRTQMDDGSTVGWLVVVALLLYTVAFVRLTFWPPFKPDHERAG